MKNTFRFMLLLCLMAFGADAQQSVLNAQFSAEKITIDGKEESAWQAATAGNVGIAMTANLDAEDPESKVNGTVRAMWDGDLLYVLVKVRDEEVTTKAERSFFKDAVEIYVDLLNDKYPKYEEDDFMLTVTADGEASKRGTISDRFIASESTLWKDASGKTIGYIVEAAVNIGGVPQVNGTEIGFEVGINDMNPETDRRQNRIYWADGQNQGLDNNARWGTLVLSGYDGTSAKALDTYTLESNIAKAEGLASGIWKSEKTVRKSLKKAKKALAKGQQAKIYASNLVLDKSLEDLRREGRFAAPLDLPEINHLPNPFQFQDGSKVTQASDWGRRADEIRDLAQYYEYGNLPAPPEKLTASLDGTKLLVKLEDHGVPVEFEAKLTIPTEAQSGKTGSFPVIVSLDFRLGDANEIYLNAGYAVLSVRYTSVASDNKEHTGPFYELYPYDITKGRDTGTLLAWAWGAMRGVDALEYIVAHDASLKAKIDVEKLVITGFSRCGKAALCAGLFDERFDVVSPGASGAGGAAVFRYVTMENPTTKQESYTGHIYSWGQSYGSEVLGDKSRHQGHNSNEMLPRFLPQDRIYKSDTYGFGERLPYDHHEIIAAIAPRAVLINTGNDDYANNPEGDAAGMEGAKPVFEFLGVTEKLGFNIRTTGEPHPRGFGGGHWLSEQQVKNIVSFSDMIFFDKPLTDDVKAQVYENPYLPTFDTYFGGKKGMMPWLESK